NHLGTLLDVVFDPKKGVPDTGWDLKGHRFAATVNQKENAWQVELAVPWRSLGLTQCPPLPAEIGLMMARNWKRPWMQMPVLPVPGFADWENYPVFQLLSEGVVFQEKSLGQVLAGIFDYRVNLTNTTSRTVAVKAAARVESTTMPALDREEQLQILP
ncbi:MAG TPA: hypothetical protein PKW42_07195, partial [bacterium]|nr:hypothetical protein [bacterium]